MTRDEFQNRYFAYRTRDLKEAQREAAAVNAIGIEGDEAVAVQFGDQWCLMLGTAHGFAEKVGIESTAVAPPLPDTIGFWAGEFGDEYNRRQRINFQDRVPFWRQIIERTGAMSFLEVGCNEAHNLEAIRSINPEAIMSGVDVNDAALAKAAAKGLDVLNAPGWEVATLFGAGACELSFTSGCLIHVAPDDLRRTMEAIRDVSSQYVLAVEYAAAEETEVNYRGHAGRLWKRDYGKLYEQLGLGLVETGAAEGFDQCQYWLLEKTR